MLDLSAIRARLAVATPGPWWVEPEQALPATYNDVADAYIAYGVQGDPMQTYDLYESYNLPDYAFLAAAREDVPALLDEIERLTVALATAERERDALLRYGIGVPGVRD
jgi:hypothetical protein